MKKKVSLVTGVAGFIGSHVAKELLHMGHEVVGIDDLSRGFAAQVPEGVRFERGSVSDRTFVGHVFNTYAIDHVYHLAAHAGEGISHYVRSFNYHNNLLGSIHLINEAVNAATVKLFVFTSASSVYGSQQGPFREEMTPRPEDPFAISKYSVELDLLSAHNLFGLNYMIFRPHDVYGEGQNLGDPYRNEVGALFNHLLKDEPMVIVGDGTQTKAFSYIADVAPLIARCVNYPEAYNQVFNIGADVPYTVNELAHQIAEAMGVSAEIQYRQGKKENKYAHCVHEKAKAYFPFYFAPVPLERGLKRMAAWAKRQGAMETKHINGLEVTKDVPGSLIHPNRQTVIAA